MPKGQSALFVSDIHSNLEALEAVLAKNAGAKVYCLGDMVGYGASPNEVVELLREMDATCIMGNHDYASVSGDVSDFNGRAAAAALWTGRTLTPENREFVRALPKSMSFEFGGAKVFMTHGSPDDNLWEYVHPTSHTDLFDHYLTKLQVDTIALGHTHMPFIWRGRKGVVFNPGSVGQPRDGDPAASFAVLSAYAGKVMVEHQRTSYNVERSARKIIAAGLPQSLGVRLFSGT